MVAVHPVPESDIENVRRLHDSYTASGESLETVRKWHREHPELFVGAYEGGNLVGYCLGIQRTEEAIELNGIAVEEAHQRQGIGTELLATFEDQVASLGFQRINLGSAGGYVDEFYLQNGYSPRSILVRVDVEDASGDYRAMGYEIAEERIDDGTKKLYIEVDEFDPAFVEEIRDSFADPDAIYILEKHLDSPS